MHSHTPERLRALWMVYVDFMRVKAKKKMSQSEHHISRKVESVHDAPPLLLLFTDSFVDRNLPSSGDEALIILCLMDMSTYVRGSFQCPRSFQTHRIITSGASVNSPDPEDGE